MADPSLYDVFRIPSETLIALDNRTFHFAVQPFHYLLRMTHIVSAAAFFGGIVLFDLRLAGLRSHVKLKAFAADTLISRLSSKSDLFRPSPRTVLLTP